MRLLQEVPPRVHALLASVLLGSGVVSLTPGFADTTVFLLPRPDVEFFLYSPWLTFVEDVSGTQEVESPTIDLPAKSLVYVREPNGHRTTDDLSEQDVFGYEIALSDVWNEKALTRFFENLESRTRLGFGQVVTSADGKVNASASIGAEVDLRRDDVFELSLEAEALYFQGGSKNDSSFDSQWYRGRMTAKVFPWRLGEFERLGLGLRGTTRYNTPTGTERDLWVHFGPVLRIGSDGCTVDFLAGYYTSYEQLDDDLPREHAGMERERLDVDAGGVTSHVAIVKEFASGVSFVLEGGVQMHSDRIRQASGRTSIRVPLNDFVERLTKDARVRNAWSRVFIEIGVEARYFDLGPHHRRALPFRENIGGTLSIVYASK